MQSICCHRNFTCSLYFARLPIHGCSRTRSSTPMLHLAVRSARAVSVSVAPRASVRTAAPLLMLPRLARGFASSTLKPTKPCSLKVSDRLAGLSPAEMEEIAAVATNRAIAREANASVAKLCKKHAAWLRKDECKRRVAGPLLDFLASAEVLSSTIEILPNQFSQRVEERLFFRLSRALLRIDNGRHSMNQECGFSAPNRLEASLP